MTVSLVCNLFVVMQAMSLTFYLALSTQIINKWERSGNGHGNQRDAEPRIAGDHQLAGHLEPDQLVDDNRKTFLGIFKSHILYFWHLMDTYDLLHRSLSQLKNELSASSLGVPTTQGLSETVQRKRKAEKEQTERDDKLRSVITEKIALIASVSVHKEKQAAQARIDELNEKILLNDDKPRLQQHYKECLKKAEQAYRELENSVRSNYDDTVYDVNKEKGNDKESNKETSDIKSSD
jgi:hypothetical protein